jgi:hypothetical protein
MGLPSVKITYSERTANVPTLLSTLKVAECVNNLQFLDPARILVEPTAGLFEEKKMSAAKVQTTGVC